MSDNILGKEFSKLELSIRSQNTTQERIYNQLNSIRDDIKVLKLNNFNISEESIKKIREVLVSTFGEDYYTAKGINELIERNEKLNKDNYENIKYRDKVNSRDKFELNKLFDNTIKKLSDNLEKNNSEKGGKSSDNSEKDDNKKDSENSDKSNNSKDVDSILNERVNKLTEDLNKSLNDKELSKNLDKHLKNISQLLIDNKLNKNFRLSDDDKEYLKNIQSSKLATDSEKEMSGKALELEHYLYGNNTPLMKQFTNAIKNAMSPINNFIGIIGKTIIPVISYLPSVLAKSFSRISDILTNGFKSLSDGIDNLKKYTVELKDSIVNKSNNIQEWLGTGIGTFLGIIDGISYTIGEYLPQLGFIKDFIINHPVSSVITGLTVTLFPKLTAQILRTIGSALGPVLALGAVAKVAYDIYDYFVNGNTEAFTMKIGRSIADIILRILSRIPFIGKYIDKYFGEGVSENLRDTSSDDIAESNKSSFNRWKSIESSMIKNNKSPEEIARVKEQFIMSNPDMLTDEKEVKVREESSSNLENIIRSLDTNIQDSEISSDVVNIAGASKVSNNLGNVNEKMDNIEKTLQDYIIYSKENDKKSNGNIEVVNQENNNIINTRSQSKNYMKSNKRSLGRYVVS